ncbi:MAG: DegT/DnrJ/EryC1/StrS family aminotransferase [Candidatus Alcyoniella australis]|nr:DegT/DnrJ/EryC1/StrS family aminotransferase [Candidatus Alcyoniella australis]
MKVNFVDLQAQLNTIRDEVSAAMLDVVDRTAFVLGPTLRNFEERFADYIGMRHCLGVSSGLDALALALAALDVGPGDEVITAANTYIATALAISKVGARPVLVEMDEFYNIDPTRVEAAITPRTKAILPVHLYGQSANIGPILELARERGLKVVEDAAQAHGAYYGEQRCGSLGDVGCFSFYPGKNLGAYGDGGAVVTDNDEIRQRISTLRDYGQQGKYVHLVKGGNHRLDDLQAAVLGVKLRYLDQWNQSRVQAAQRYGELLDDSKLTLPKRADWGTHVYHLYVVRAPQRDELLQFMASREVYCGIHYPTPLHLQPAYADLGLGQGAFPRTEQAAGELLSLPMFPEITPEQQAFVAQGIAEFYA